MYFQIVGTNVRLAGSMHVIPAGYGPLPSWVSDAYEWGQEICIESNSDELVHYAFYPPGVTLKQKLPAEIWNQLERVWKFAPLDSQKIWLILIMLPRLSVQLAEGVEHYLIDRAKADGKPIGYLETVAEFAKAADEIPDESYFRLLSSSLTNLPGAGVLIGEMYAAWLSGRVHALEDIFPKTMLAREPVVREAVFDARNKAWLPKILASLTATKRTLLVVGAGHLVGPNGLLSMLDRSGRDCVQLA